MIVTSGLDARSRRASSSACGTDHPWHDRPTTSGTPSAAISRRMRSTGRWQCSTTSDQRSRRRTAAVQAKWDELERREKLHEQRRNSMYNRHVDQEFLWELVSNQTILDALEPLLGPNILLFGSRIICKWGNDETFVAWHQDVSER